MDATNILSKAQNKQKVTPPPCQTAHECQIKINQQKKTTAKKEKKKLTLKWPHHDPEDDAKMLKFVFSKHSNSTFTSVSILMPLLAHKNAFSHWKRSKC